MATIVLNVQDETQITQIKKACMLLKGVVSVKVEKNSSTKAKTKELDITKTASFKEAMDDVKQGRITQYDSTDDLFQKLGITL